MTVVVASAHADHRDAGLDRVEERLAGRRPAAVMSNLEDVDSTTVREPALEQLRVDVVLSISRE